MNGIIRHTLSEVAIMLCLLAGDVASQNAKTALEITTTDGVSTAIDTFGISFYGTYCLDGCLYTGFCEEELPIFPPPIFDVRFVESRPGSSCLGNGVRVNIQHGEPSKPDTFVLSITQPNTDRYPIILTWRFLDYPYGLIDADVKITSMWMSDTGGGLLNPVNMLSDSTTTLSDPRISLLRIITTSELWLDVDEQHAVPSGFSLFQNYPNPFNPGTTISYRLATPEFVELSIYDGLGRQVSILDQGRRSIGLHKVHFEATALPSGLYIARMVTPSRTQSLKVLYLK